MIQPADAIRTSGGVGQARLEALVCLGRLDEDQCSHRLLPNPGLSDPGRPEQLQDRPRRRRCPIGPDPERRLPAPNRCRPLTVLAKPFDDRTGGPRARRDHLCDLDFDWSFGSRRRGSKSAITSSGVDPTRRLMPPPRPAQWVAIRDRGPNQPESARGGGPQFWPRPPGPDPAGLRPRPARAQTVQPGDGAQFAERSAEFARTCGLT